MISFDELESLVRPDSELSEQEKIERAFKVIDTDGNGLIGPEEFQYALAQIGEEMSIEEISKLIRVFDWDVDGFINIRGRPSFIVVS